MNANVPLFTPIHFFPQKVNMQVCLFKQAVVSYVLLKMCNCIINIFTLIYTCTISCDYVDTEILQR